MKTMREEFDLGDKSLTGSGLVESLYKTKDALIAVNKTGREFTLGAGELGRIGMGVNVRALSIGNINIIATVREEDDVRKIRTSLEELFNKGYRSRGGDL